MAGDEPAVAGGGDVALSVVAEVPPASAADRDDAVDALFRLHCADLVRLAVCLLGDRGAAEDVVQDAFLALHRGWWRLRAETSALAYLRAAVVNGCRSRQRRLVRARRVTPLLALAAGSGGPSGEDEVLARDEAHRVAAAVQRLPGRQREVIVCRYFLGLSEAQTAALLGVSLGSAKRHAHRAMAALGQRIEVGS